MKYYMNGIEYTAPDLDAEKLLTIVSQKTEEDERRYWQMVKYDDAVEREVAKVYSIGQELAIQRQKDEKPEEYEEYYNYCEQCKAYVKERKAYYTTT